MINSNCTLLSRLTFLVITFSVAAPAHGNSRDSTHVPRYSWDVYLGGVSPLGSTRRIGTEQGFTLGGGYDIYLTKSTTVGLQINFGILEKDSISDSCYNVGFCPEETVFFHELSLRSRHYLQRSGSVKPYLSGAFGWSFYLNRADAPIESRKDTRSIGISYGFGGGVLFSMRSNSTDQTFGIFIEGMYYRLSTTDDFAGILPIRLGVMWASY